VLITKLLAGEAITDEDLVASRLGCQCFTLTKTAFSHT
jgi:hypothetical protein